MRPEFLEMLNFATYNIQNSFTLWLYVQHTYTFHISAGS